MKSTITILLIILIAQSHTIKLRITNPNKFSSISQASRSETTCKSCECDSECNTGSNPFGIWDWCWTKNSCGFQGLNIFSHYDYCKYPPLDVENLNDISKQSYLWENVIKNASPGPWGSPLKASTESMKTTFENHGDVMVTGRVKAIHSVGFVAKIKLIGTSIKYTGAFSETSLGFLRAGFIVQPEVNLVKIGIALKIFRSKVESANVVAFDNPTGQKEFDFFNTDMKNHVKSPMDLALKIGAEKFKQATGCINMVGLKGFSTHTKDGALVVKPNYPFELIFMPQYHMPTTNTADKFTQEGQLEEFKKIPAGTPLQEIYAYEDPDHMFMDDDRFPGKNVYTSSQLKQPHSELIGKIITDSEFTGSNYGDLKLHFRHQYMENDFEDKPEWISQIGNNMEKVGGNSWCSPDIINKNQCS